MTVSEESATETESGTAAHGVTMTDAAAGKAKALLDQEGRDDLALRIAVQPGGCAGSGASALAALTRMPRGRHARREPRR